MLVLHAEINAFLLQNCLVQQEVPGPEAGISPSLEGTRSIECGSLCVKGKGNWSCIELTEGN